MFSSGYWERSGVREEQKEDGTLVLEFDVPGFSKEEVKVYLYEKNIVVEGQNDKRKIRRTYYVGKKLTRSDKIFAGLKDGVLIVKVEKEAFQPTFEGKEIPIT